MNVAQIETTDYLSCRKAAKALKLSPQTIRKYLNNAGTDDTPQLEGMKVDDDGEWLIHKDEIARYKKERQGRGRPGSNGH